MSNIAFLLIVGGVLLVYCELIWLGKLIFGVTGGLLMILGTALLWRLPHSGLGLALIGAAIVIFGLEARFRTHYLAGIAGSIFWAIGFWKLCPAPDEILPQVVFPVTVLFGGVSTFLLGVAKRARANKRADL